jgi:hypothetical protein
MFFCWKRGLGSRALERSDKCKKNIVDKTSKNNSINIIKKQIFCGRSPKGGEPQ